MALKIGFTNKYFTLWDVKLETEYYTDGNGKHWPHYNRTYYTYWQNLSFDEDKAIEKAKAKGCTDLVPDTELYGTTKSWVKTEKLEIPPEVFEAHEFHYGKNFRKDIRECESMGYLKWFYREGSYTSDEQKEILIDTIVSKNPDWWKKYEGELMSVEQVELIEKGAEYVKFIKKNGFLDVEIPKNCDDHGRLFVGIDIMFPEVREHEYNGFEYYLPKFDGKCVRIKKKNVRLYFKNYNGEYWMVESLQVLKKK